MTFWSGLSPCIRSKSVFNFSKEEFKGVDDELRFAGEIGCLVINTNTLKIMITIGFLGRILV